MALRSLGVILASLLCLQSVAAAEESGPPSVDAGPTMPFDIPSQPLEQALLTYSRVANIQVLYDAALVQTQRSSALHGSYPATEALVLMLRGTGLRVRYATTNAITLTAVSRAEEENILHVQTMRIQGSPESIDRRRMTIYAQSVEDRILQALRSDPSTGHMAFDVKIQLWIGQRGQITRVEMPAMDMEDKADRAITRVVQTVGPIDPPPADLPQPLLFHFRAHPAF